MHCHHHAAGRCGSCTLLAVPHVAQVADKQAHAEDLLRVPAWLPAIRGRESGFRNKAKMAVGGTAQEPTLGILDGSWNGVDLRDCALHEPDLVSTLDAVSRFVTLADLTPYDVAERRGELKHVLLTASPAGEMLLRLVMRSTATESRVRKHLPTLLEWVPRLRVVTINVQPEPKAVLEGDREIVLSEATTLQMRLSTGVTLRLGPKSFFQTNTEVAEALYERARTWADDLAPASVWDLYCGVGGFGLHLSAPDRDVLGVEISAEAIAAANESASEIGAERTAFVAADATRWVLEGAEGRATPDLVVVNPPRRGIGEQLAGWLESSAVGHVIYSSCNAHSLAKDLAAMPSLRPVAGQVLDMFPHTSHYEVMVLLERAPA